MRFFAIPDRTKITNELSRRFDEVQRRSEKGISNDEEAQQFISLLAHYVQYVKENELTKQAVERMFKRRDILASDQALIDEAEKIIEEMKIDRAKLIRFAKSKGISTDNYQFRNGQTITGEIEFSFNLNHLNGYLDLPSDQQLISDLPRSIGDLLSMNFVAQQQGGETKSLKEMRQKYRDIQNSYSKKLKLQGVFLDFLRVEDFRAIEKVWKEVYAEGVGDELLIFHLEYGHLFEKNRHYSGGQAAEANDFLTKHMTHLQRFHNYLMDALEDVPKKEKFLKWTVEHFGPTFVSVLVLLAIYLILYWLGIKIELDTLKDYIGP